MEETNAGKDDRYDLRTSGKWHIVTIREEVHSEADFSWIRRLVNDLLNKNASWIAVEFLKQSHLYSKVISVLVGCAKIARKEGGTLALINPGKHIVQTLKFMNLYGRLVEVYPSEKELP